MRKTGIHRKTRKDSGHSSCIESPLKFVSNVDAEVLETHALRCIVKSQLKQGSCASIEHHVKRRQWIQVFGCKSLN